MAQTNKMTTKLTGTFRITNEANSEVWSIDQDDNGRFYITSSNGYNGYEGNGYSSLTAAIKHVNTQIKNYYHDRCIEEEKGTI